MGDDTSGRTRPDRPLVEESEARLFDCILGDGVVTGLMISAIFDAVYFRARGARVVLSGSTGTRHLLISSARRHHVIGGARPELDAFPPSDADVDVYAGPRSLDQALDAIDRAVTDIVLDPEIVREILSRVPEPFETGKQQHARNSRVYTKNSRGELVGVDVPSFGANRRLPHGSIFITKNATVPGLPCLHRIRVQMSDGDRRFSIPLMDIKTRDDIMPRLARPVLVGGTMVCVPTAEEAELEIRKLLDGTYERVDATKFDRREEQGRVLRRMLTGSRSY